MLPCPKCGVKSDGGVECGRCGLVFEKWRPNAQTKRFDYSLSGSLALLVIIPALFVYGPDAYEWLVTPTVHFVAVAPEIIAAEERAAGEAFDDWYPEDLSPPEDLRYPCAMTPLPRAPRGVPASNRRFLNHAFALVLRAARERLKVQAALAAPEPPEQALADYTAAMKEILGLLRAEPAPQSLEGARADLLSAWELQGEFYAQAFEQRRLGMPVKKIVAGPERREANRKLLAVRARLKGRYPGWDAALRDSVYHHLCNAAL